MTNPTYPPLPDYMTLEEAAEAVSIRLGGQQWSVRHLLGCAERGEFLIRVRLPAACRLVRVVPYKEGCDEFPAEANSLPTISLAACHDLLLAGVADFDGIAGFRDLPDWFTGGEPLLSDNGKPMRNVVLTWRLADGETPPEIRLEDCRVTADSLEGLIASYTPRLEPADQQPEKAADQGKNAPLENWMMKVQAEAAKRWREQREQGCNPTRNSLKDELAKWCRETGVKTTSDISPTAEYLYRHVLSKKHWTPPDN